MRQAMTVHWRKIVPGLNMRRLPWMAGALVALLGAPGIASAMPVDSPAAKADVQLPER